jgi:hypothetical protein
MDEVVLRLVLIGGALLVTVTAISLVRSSAKKAPRRLESTGLRSGVYLFSSSACPDCHSARQALDAAFGESGFAEFNWEENPGLFHDLAVDAVPATLVVADDGSGTLWTGQPGGALASLGP